MSAKARNFDRMVLLRSKRLSSFCLLFAVVLVAAPATQSAAIPADDLLKSLKPTGHVNDFANLLTPSEKEGLEARCKQLQDRTGAQLAIVTLKSLQGGEVDDFAVKLFKKWGIGEKKDRNGILLLVSVDDRKARIEVGYDIEPIIPDMLTVRILEGKLAPQFRDKQYAAGLQQTVAAISELVEKGEPADREALARPNDWFTTVLFLCIFVGFGGFALGLGLGVPAIPFAIFGLFFGGMATALGYGVGGSASLMVHLPLGIVTALAGFKLAKQGGGPHGGRRYSLPSSGWDWGSFPTSSSGGWSSGGGGYSQDWGGFGGGSSGGGGGSISW